MWTHTGNKRPPFAAAPRSGQESVWDYPRPPALRPDARRVVVRAGGRVIGDTRRAVRVLEAASPPTFYLPPDHMDLSLLRPAGGGSHCEWKGRAAYWSVVVPEHAALDAAAWSYPEPTPAFATLAG